MLSVYQVMPPLTADEYAALKADIAEHGVRVPVDVDEQGNILDGHHRAQIAAELGIAYETRIVAGLDEEGKRDHALAVNAQRRTLNQEQRRRLIATELRRDPLRSDRAIGRKLGVDGKTVGAVRRDLEEADRLRREEAARERELNRQEAIAYVKDRVSRASRAERTVWAGWVAAHDPGMAARVAGSTLRLVDAAGEVRANTGCDLGCDHTPQPPPWAGAEIPHHQPPFGTLGPYRVHPALDIWPWVDDELFAAIVHSIKEHGLRQPILLTHDESTLVDGRIRYLACEAAGVEPRYRTLPADWTEEQIVGCILSLNSVRQTLTPDQWAIGEAEIFAAIREGAV